MSTQTSEENKKQPEWNTYKLPTHRSITILTKIIIILMQWLPLNHLARLPDILWPFCRTAWLTITGCSVFLERQAPAPLPVLVLAGCGWQKSGVFADVCNTGWWMLYCIPIKAWPEQLYENWYFEKLNAWKRVKKGKLLKIMFMDVRYANTGKKTLKIFATIVGKLLTHFKNSIFHVYSLVVTLSASVNYSKISQ